MCVDSKLFLISKKHRSDVLNKIFSFFRLKRRFESSGVVFSLLLLEENLIVFVSMIRLLEVRHWTWRFLAVESTNRKQWFWEKLISEDKVHHLNPWPWSEKHAKCSVIKLSLNTSESWKKVWNQNEIHFYGWAAHGFKNVKIYSAVQCIWPSHLWTY